MGGEDHRTTSLHLHATRTRDVLMGLTCFTIKVMDWRRKAAWKFTTFDAEGYRRRCDFFSLSLIFKIFIFVAFWNVCKDKLFIHKPILIRPARPVGCSDGEASRSLIASPILPHVATYLGGQRASGAPCLRSRRRHATVTADSRVMVFSQWFSPWILPSGSLSLCPAVGAALAHSSSYARALGYTVAIHYEDSSPRPSRYLLISHSNRQVCTDTHRGLTYKHLRNTQEVS